MSKLDEVMKNFNKTFKEDLVHQGLAEHDYKRIPFTSPRMNYCTFGGLPVGKLIEFFGDNGGGKTTTALDVVANYQLMSNAKKVLWADCENTLDVEWATKIGVKVDELIIVQPTNQSAEDIFQLVLDMIETDEIGLIVIDSLGVMVSAQAMDKDLTEKTYCGIAGPLTTFSKKAEMLCQRTKSTLIGINQVREDMNSMYGGTTTPGGKAWKHNCAVRMEFRKGEYIDEKGGKLTRNVESPAGNIVYMHMVKNKTCPPTRKTGFYTLKYDIGIDYLADLIDVCIKYDIISKRGAWFDIINTETGEVIQGNIQGQARVEEYLSNPENVADLELVELLVDKAMND